MLNISIIDTSESLPDDQGQRRSLQARAGMGSQHVQQKLHEGTLCRCLGHDLVVLLVHALPDHGEGDPSSTLIEA